MLNFVDINCDYLKLKNDSDVKDCIDDDPDYIEYLEKFKHDCNDILGYGKYVIKYDDYNNFIERLNSRPQNNKGYMETDVFYTFCYKTTQARVLMIKLLKCAILPKVDIISQAYLDNNYKKIKNIIDQYKKYLSYPTNIDYIIAYNIATIYQLELNKKYEKEMMYYYTIAISHGVHLSFYNLYIYYKNINPSIAKKYHKLGIKYGDISCQIFPVTKVFFNSSDEEKRKHVDVLLDAYMKDKTNIETIIHLANAYYRINCGGKMLYFINKSIEYHPVYIYTILSNIELRRNHIKNSLVIQKNALDMNKSHAHKKYIISGIVATTALSPLFYAFAHI